jgi:hypothetical protein
MQRPVVYRSPSVPPIDADFAVVVRAVGYEPFDTTYLAEHFLNLEQDKSIYTGVRSSISSILGFSSLAEEPLSTP